MVAGRGFASLEPPDKLSTGQFSPADKLLSQFSPNSNPLLLLNNKKYSSKNATVFLVVAGRGFEPPDLRVMSPTSYQAALPRGLLLFIKNLFS